MKALATMQNTEEYFPNGLKVSKTDNPMFFPVENTYQVGSAEILALMSNTIAVGTGQTGDAPLYVFCKDGVYALYVDDSGQMAYPNARILARDVCNNPRSVTPIDAGVVFSTDRGLMMIAGEQVQEIGEPAEGDVLLFADDESADYIKIAGGVFTKVAGLSDSLCDTTDFLTYLKGAIINYNHNERELMVSNPDKSYSYILDRNYNWSRRDYTADQYVNNYPTSYRFVNGEFYKVDEDGTDDTPLEERKESDNRFFYLSNVIKLGSIGFKQGARFVVRGYFESWLADKDYVQDTISDRNVYITGQAIESLADGESLRMAYIHIHGIDAWAEIDEVGIPGNVLNVTIYDAQTMNDVTHTIRETGLPGDYITIVKQQPDKRPTVGCYIFGSYDGRKWALLGGNEKQGKFTNIGCLVSHVDIRFYRVCLAGQITGKTRIDYMELSSKGSMLNTKIR